MAAAPSVVEQLRDHALSVCNRAAHQSVHGQFDFLSLSLARVRNSGGMRRACLDLVLHSIRGLPWASRPAFIILSSLWCSNRIRLSW